MEKKLLSLIPEFQLIGDLELQKKNYQCLGRSLKRSKLES